MNSLQSCPEITGNHRRILFLASMSLVPIYAFTRSRWTSRLGLDSLHVVLLQLLFSLLLTQRWSSSTHGRTHEEIGVDDGPKLEAPKTNPGSCLKDTTTSGGIAQSLKALVDQPVDWINVFPTPGLEILRHRSMKSVYAIRTEIEEDQLTLEQLVRCITDSKQWEWDRMCECGEDLGDGLTWIRLKGFWPIKPKELVMQSCIFKLPPSDSSKSIKNGDQVRRPIRILAASTSTNHPLKKSTLEIKFAGYLIEQLSPSSPIRVTQIVDLSGFGPLPTFVTKAILTKFAPSSLRKLITLAQQSTPRQSSPDQLDNADSPPWMPPSLEDSITCHSPSSLDRSGEEERLKQMIEQLKNIINDLQTEHNRSGKTGASKDPPGWLRSPKLLSVVLGTGFAICSSIIFKNRKSLLASRLNRKVRWL